MNLIEKRFAPANRHEDWMFSVAWSIVLGFISGLACVGVRLFFRLLQWVLTQHGGLLPEAARALSPERRLLTPVLGALCATAVLFVARKWGTLHSNEYVEAVRHHDGRISLSATLWKTMSAAFSVATGAAVGREGSMIQFASAVTAWFGEEMPTRGFPLSRQVACGAAAAVAAAYQAPIAGIFFAAEIVLGEWSWMDLPHFVLPATAGWLVSRTLLGDGPLFPVHEAFTLSHDYGWALVLAVVLGLLGPLYHPLLRSFRFASRWPLALLWSGLLVGALSLLKPEVWGNGDVALASSLQGGSAFGTIATVLVLRLVATAFCVGSGTNGGVFTPTIFAGAAMGFLAGGLLHVSAPVLLAVVGMGAFLSAVTHAPLMASCMVAELTGQWHILPLLLLCDILAWQIARRITSDSLYAIATPEPADEHAATDAKLLGNPAYLTTEVSLQS